VTSNTFWQLADASEVVRQMTMSRTGPEVVRIKRKRDDDAVDYLRSSYYSPLGRPSLMNHRRLRFRQRR